MRSHAISSHPLRSLWIEAWMERPVGMSSASTSSASIRVRPMGRGRRQGQGQGRRTSARQARTTARNLAARWVAELEGSRGSEFSSFWQSQRWRQGQARQRQGQQAASAQPAAATAHSSTTAAASAASTASTRHKGFGGTLYIKRTVDQPEESSCRRRWRQGPKRGCATGAPM